MADETASLPVVQMLVPGFRVREIPVELTNVNNVRYRGDGKLVALAYNGNVYVLEDSDGDQLEDKVQLFWENDGTVVNPLGLVVTQAASPHKRSVFITCNRAVIRLRDRDGDDRADEATAVASGWETTEHGVDALGLAMDDQGQFYFGIGTANYANPYLIDAQGRSAYRRDSERGTIQKLSPDFEHRSTVASGIRFPVGIAVNHLGDLFCTDQEGATWLGNGNPFDELLHVQPGRHYGFPPRHPRHNPDVIDEPAVYEYGPQHQSACGLAFNEPLSDGTAFGPPHWRHDAIVCGESRGSLWRTSLVKSPVGYVAANQTIARLQMLTVDACIAPRGGLVVCCHSGPPDWGTGPTGKGRLFRIEPRPDCALPRPVVAWFHSADEIRIALDGPLSPDVLGNDPASIRVDYGRYVRAGQQFETLKPPYEIVDRQYTEPRHSLAVREARLSSGGRTIIIRTEPVPPNLPAESRCAITIRLPGSSPPSEGVSHEIPQQPLLCVDCSLAGVWAEWRSDGESRSKWSGWLPHLDLHVCRELLRESEHHAALWPLLEQDGLLTLRTRLDVNDILRPKKQLGAQLDYEWPEETVELRLAAAPQGCRATIGPRDEPVHVRPTNGGVEVRFAGRQKPWRLLRVEIPTGGGPPPETTVSVRTNEDARERALTIERFRLPWTNEPPQEQRIFPYARQIPQLAGGQWERGRQLFYSEKARCSQCHTLDGSSQGIGPDLKNLVHRDAYSVMQDIQFPSQKINPDYISHTVVLKSGMTLLGIVRRDAEGLTVSDQQGKKTRIDPAEIEQMQPATISTMPQDIARQLSEAEMRDLLIFLLRRPPRMPQYGPTDPPPPRERDEVLRALTGASSPKAGRPLDVVLVAGPKDHGPGEHDYPAWLEMWHELLAFDASLSISTAKGFPSSAQLAEADVLVFYQRGAWNRQRQQALDAYLNRGGGAMFIHWAVDGGENALEFAQRIGWAGGAGLKYRHGPQRLLVENATHPIMRNIRRLELHDESYWNFVGDGQSVVVLASSEEEGSRRPQIWVTEHGEGRVFVSIPGHFSWTFDDPLFRLLLLRGMAWVAHEDVDRFSPLVFPGARIR